MKKIKFILVLVVIMVLLSGCVLWYREPTTLGNYDVSNKAILSVVSPPSVETSQCYSFIKQRLTSSLGGIYTNYQRNDTTSETSTGHEILSESMGLLMEYGVLTKDEPLFNATVDYIVEHFIVNNILLWRIDEEKIPITNVSSTIDDLRIYQALCQAQEQWPLSNTSTTLMKTLEGQLSSQILNSNYLLSYYGTSVSRSDTVVEMAYIDLGALSSLTQANPQLQESLDMNKKTLLGSYIGDNLPLYHKTYDTKKDTYGDSNGRINILDSLMVILNLAQIGTYESSSLDWLKTKTAEGSLYSYYDLGSGKALDTRTSSAAYGLAAQIGAALGDDTLTSNALIQLKKYQDKDPQSLLYGGFGYDNNAYSYDNLQALLGLVYNKYVESE